MAATPEVEAKITTHLSTDDLHSAKITTHLSTSDLHSAKITTHLSTDDLHSAKKPPICPLVIYIQQK